jgi:hypothetical protein
MPNSSLTSLGGTGSTGVLDPTPGAQQNYPPQQQMSQYPPQYQQQMQQEIQAIKQQQAQGQKVQAPSDPQRDFMHADWAVSQNQYEVDYRTIQFFEINKDIQGLRKKRVPFGLKPSNQRYWSPYSTLERNGMINVGITKNFVRLMFPFVPMFFFFYIAQPIIHGNIYIMHYNNF